MSIFRIFRPHYDVISFFCPSLQNTKNNFPVDVNSTHIQIDLFSIGVNISSMVFLVHSENFKKKLSPPNSPAGRAECEREIKSPKFYLPR
jgi:hypothetical protein